MNGSTKTLMTGIFVLVSFLILVWVILWLEPSVGDEGQVIHVRFTNIDKINDGTRVTFAGQPVGVVYEVREVKDARLEPHDDRVYVYELTLHVDSELDVYTTDLFSVRTSGLLGERSIEITPVARGCCNDLVPITPKDILFAVPTGSVEEAFSQFSSLSKGAKQIFDKVGDAVDKLEENHFWDNLALIADHLESVANIIDDKPKLEDMMNNFHAFSEDAKNAGEKIDEVLKEALKASENLANLTELFEKVMERVARGEGTVGRFLVKDDFYMDLKAILGKAQILMGDITQYGLLFQNSKKWQRVQAGRQNLVGQLQSPWEFENFFGREVCGIQRSLNDLGERLEEPNCDPRAFCSDLREMMRRVDGLNEHLQMFNTQLHDAGGCR